MTQRAHNHPIERSSTMLQTLLEDENEETIHYDTEVRNLFPVFVVGKTVRSDVDTLMLFLNVFNVLYDQKVFETFRPPDNFEYFAEPLNHLLLLDFFISFHKVLQPTFDTQQITPHLWASFFFALGDFFNFMDYLSVDERVTNYLKYMVCLFAIKYHIPRSIIEERLGGLVFVLDEFFQRVVLEELMDTFDYKRVKQLNRQMVGFDSDLSVFHGEHDDTYLADEYNHLDDKYHVEICTHLNPVCFYKVRCLNNYEDSVDSDYESDLEEEEEDTPEMVEEKRQAVLRKFGKLRIERDKCKQQLEHAIRSRADVCSHMKLNDYQIDHSDPDNFQLLTAIGVKVQFETLLHEDKDMSTNLRHLENTFCVACKYGHLHLIQQMIPYMKTLDNHHYVCSLQESPNIKSILQWMYSARDHIPTIKQSKSLATMFKMFLPNFMPHPETPEAPEDSNCVVC